MAPFTYLGTQLGEERSTSQVAYRFMWTGRLEVMLTGLEGCMCGEGTPPVRGSPPRSDILEAQNGLSAQERNTPGSLASPSVCVVLFGCLLLPLAYFFTLAAVRMRKTLPRRMRTESRTVSRYSPPDTGHIAVVGVGARGQAVIPLFRLVCSPCAQLGVCSVLVGVCRCRKRKFLSPESHIEHQRASDASSAEDVRQERRAGQ